MNLEKSLSTPSLIRILAAPLSFGVLAYVALQIWRRQKNDGEKNAGADFRPSIGFTRLDGWASLALLSRNKSESPVWIEEIEIALTDLIAVDQTSEPSYHEILKIHQTVQRHDMLPVSLMEVIYKAAGKPQRKYSCLMSSIVRYRVGENWFEKPMQPQRLKLAGLTVEKARGERWNMTGIRPVNDPRETQLVETKSKPA